MKLQLAPIPVLLTLAFVVALLSSAGRAQAPAATADEAAVTALVARYNEARDVKDPAAIGAIFTDDADQLVSTGEWRRGRDTLVQGMLKSSQSQPGDRTITVEAVRLLGRDVAIADARYEIANPGGEPRRMWSTFVAVRTADGWRIAAIRNMLPAK
ncbi:MAG: SgcJ/EcaC family oxidoreductase [Vicinamibacteraceae bacterium]|nr:SgcJ/EcaC family oxidoreductase [Vicinamibacteraceae bacterium]